ncbi:MAG: NADAR family protein [Candidatus Lokiarchaeota archaeon]|nr:NADAR family protein [Candidatus Lokiarchaeota archaeon]
MTIKEFKGKFRFLSNFYSSPFSIRGIEYKTVEHWFQSQKSTKSEEQTHVINASTPGEAKKRGRQVNLRTDWNETRLSIMEEGLRAKFNQNPNIRELLIKTGDQELQEGNRWGDTFWGINLRTGKGQNHLGKLLEKIRKELTPN